MEILRIVTSFGDLVVLLPLAAALAFWLARQGTPRLTAYWILSVLFCIAVTAVLKIYFVACGSVHSAMHSPSGHTSLSVLVYGALATIVATEQTGIRRQGVVALAVLFVLAIAGSRLALHAHSLEEVLLGGLVGGLSLAAFLRAYLRHHLPQLKLGQILMVMVVLPVALTGHSPNVETFVRSVGHYLHESGMACFGSPDQ